MVAAGVLFAVAAASSIAQLWAVKYRRAGAPDVFHGLYRFDEPLLVKISFVEDAEQASARTVEWWPGRRGSCE